MKTHRTRVLCFLTPAAILLAVMLLLRTYPLGGDQTLLICDADGHYRTFLLWLRHVLTGQADFFYSLQRTLGGSMAGIFGYYTASPLNLLMLLFPEEKIIEAYTVIILCKLGLCGLCTCLYLEKRRLPAAATLMLSGAYALCGWCACYFWNIMWLDGVALLPIIVLGIERVTQGEKPFLYLFALGLALCCNYYIGYMLCIFSVLWLIFSLLSMEAMPRGGQLVRVLGRFVLASLLAGGLAAVILLPVFFALQGYGGISLKELSLEPIHRMVELFSKLFTGAASPGQVLKSDGMAQLYVGMPVLALMAGFFTHPGIRRKERVSLAALLGFLILSLQCKGLYMLWHGLDSPGGMPARFSFLFSFVVMIAALRMVEERDTLNPSRVGWLPPLFVLVAVLVFGATGLPDYLAYETVVLDGAIFAAACLLILLLRRRPKVAMVALCGLQIISLLLNSYLSLHRVLQDGTMSASTYQSWLEETGEAVREIQAKDGGLYRVETNNPRTENDGLTLGYNSLTHYSSDFRSDEADFLHSLGFYQSYMRTMYGAGLTPAMESLLGVKYVLFDPAEALTDRSGGQSEGLCVLENPDALSFGLIVPQEENLTLTDDPFENQNRLFADLLGRESCEMLTKVEGLTLTTGQDGLQQVRFPITEGTDYYLHTEGSWFAQNGGDMDSSRAYRGTPLLRGETTGEMSLDIYYTEGVTDHFYLAQWQPEIYDEAIALLKTLQAEVTRETDSRVTVHTDCDEEGRQLLLTIAWDEGWSAKVDGVSVPTHARYGHLLSVDLPAGQHTVELCFVPKGLIAGAVISGVAGGGGGVAVADSPQGERNSETVKLLAESGFCRASLQNHGCLVWRFLPKR